MTRPPVRMCARCERTTEEPVLVHEVHAATGPGFNVYACSDCADHYPPRTDPYELLGPTSRRSRLTLRVYRVGADGNVAEERDRIEVLVRGGTLPVSRTSAFPPCGCPRCRTR
ncbi:hypothetical protein KUF83_07290 [Streptomyces sp. BV286]|uniref:hypothetical protein n=1 Tax=Streptomyces sp. BV286 TaxID=2849672 RepID=UPI001C2E233B|nr:hypothetical protein [Streptomyces sp. BV286]MBV1936368.1 hypothetical protein [Streptomyces sp. BV286]